MTKLLLTSSGLTNQSIQNALTELLGKSIQASNALFIPTGVYPFVGGANYAWWPIAGKKKSSLVDLGWKTIGLLELTALNSIDQDCWLPSITEADALLVWGGDPLYLAYWFQHSGLTDVLSSLKKNLVYVGVSAGSMAACSIIGETYSQPRRGFGNPLTTEDISFTTTDGEINRIIMTARGIGLVEFSIIPHFENPDHSDACNQNAEKWASKIPAPVYAIDEHTAIQVAGDQIKVISEGQWKLFNNLKTGRSG